MLGIDEINLLKSQNEGLKKQNEELQKEIRILQNRNQQLDGATTKAKCYEKALDEIEKEIHTLGSLITIQDIINKAKDINVLTEKECNNDKV